MSTVESSATPPSPANGAGRISVQMQFPFASVSVASEGMPALSLGALKGAVEKIARSDAPREDLELILQTTAQARAKQEITQEQLDELRVALSTVRFAHLSAAERDAIIATTTAATEDWQASLAWNYKGTGKAKKKTLAATPGNAALIMSRESAWNGCLAFDEFACAVRWVGAPPPVPGLTSPAGELKDADLVYVQQWLRLTHKVTFSREAVAAAVEAAARARSTHPVREYLRSLRWDGLSRLDTWLRDCLGAADTPANRDIGRWWLISAVARVMQPGCQADHVIVLEGEQGWKKSTAVRVLAGPWFCGSLGDLRNKDAYQQLQGHWIVEIGELDAIRGVGATRVKDFITQTIDVFRPPYGRNTVRRPRQCVFAATTNDDHYLQDATGGRRFWPVAVGKIDIDRLKLERGQVWAEALARYEAGVRWWPEGVEANRMGELQEDRFAADAWEDEIAARLLWVEEEISTQDLLGHLDVDKSRWDRGALMRVAAIMRRLGWKQQRKTEKGVRLRRWERGPAATPWNTSAKPAGQMHAANAPEPVPKVLNENFDY